jgi:hypothetical protein
MRTSIALILTAALFAAPAAFAQSADPGSSNTGNSGLKVKPSADTPAKQKERTQDYSKVPGKPGSKSGPAEQPNR